MLDILIRFCSELHVLGAKVSKTAHKQGIVGPAEYGPEPTVGHSGHYL